MLITVKKHVRVRVTIEKVQKFKNSGNPNSVEAMIT